jgi:hypothetical protein
MKAKINSVILCNITQQLTRGRPLWAMARLNEYLEVSDPLRKALASKALSLINKSISPEIADKLVTQGCRLNELTASQQEELLLQEPAVSTAPVKFTLTNRLSKGASHLSATKRTFIRARFASA